MTDIDRDRLFAGGLEALGVSIAPTWRADTHQAPRHVDLVAPGIARDATDTVAGLFPSGLAFDVDGDTADPHNVARHLIAGLAAGALHEGLEWVRVDGERLGAPHPDADDDFMWDWVVARLVDVVADYQTRHPDHPAPSEPCRCRCECGASVGEGVGE